MDGVEGTGVLRDFHSLGAFGNPRAHPLAPARILNTLSVEGEECLGDLGNIERRRAPLRCDGCGRAAGDAGMVDHGWAVSPLTAAVPGTYCLRCASALQMLQWFVRCVECGATAEDEAAAERQGWRYYVDSLGNLEPHCGLCSASSTFAP